jgi:hypothetical protein
LSRIEAATEFSSAANRASIRREPVPSVLAYLSCYTHRVAIANSRLIRADADSVTFRVKDYRVEGRSRDRAATPP